MLRAVVWRHDVDVRVGRKALDTGHDLRQLLERVAALGLLKQGERDADFRASVQRVARLWFNNMRFASSRKLAADWRRSGDVHARRTVKKAAADFYDDCGEISRRCEALL